MAFPKLLQKLFQNNGAGDKLNQDIIPDIPYSKITDAPVVDSALSSTSENPVQNKVINSALDGKLSTSGGTVNGTITIANGGSRLAILRGAGMKDFEIRGADNDGYMQIFPGETADYSQKKSASLLLSSAECTLSYVRPGAFALTAMNATTGAKTLHGDPDGTLMWCGKSLTGGLTVVAESYSANSWYRKYSDGWIEQGGIFYYSTSTRPHNNNRVTLAIPFSTAVYGYAIGGPASATSSYDTGGDSGSTYYATVSFAGVNKTQVLFSASQQDHSTNVALSIPVVAWGK